MKHTKKTHQDEGELFAGRIIELKKVQEDVFVRHEKMMTSEGLPSVRSLYMFISTYIP